MLIPAALLVYDGLSESAVWPNILQLLGMALLALTILFGDSKWLPRLFSRLNWRKPDDDTHGDEPPSLDSWLVPAVVLAFGLFSLGFLAEALLYPQNLGIEELIAFVDIGVWGALSLWIVSVSARAGHQPKRLGERHLREEGLVVSYRGEDRLIPWSHIIRVRREEGWADPNLIRVSWISMEDYHQLSPAQRAQPCGRYVRVSLVPITTVSDEQERLLNALETRIAA